MGSLDYKRQQLIDLINDVRDGWDGSSITMADEIIASDWLDGLLIGAWDDGAFSTINLDLNPYRP